MKLHLFPLYQPGAATKKKGKRGGGTYWGRKDGVGAASSILFRLVVLAHMRGKEKGEERGGNLEKKKKKRGDAGEVDSIFLPLCVPVRGRRKKGERGEEHPKKKKKEGKTNPSVPTPLPLFWRRAWEQGERGSGV